MPVNRTWWRSSLSRMEFRADDDLVFLSFCSRNIKLTESLRHEVFRFSFILNLSENTSWAHFVLVRRKSEWKFSSKIISTHSENSNFSPACFQGTTVLGNPTKIERIGDTFIPYQVFKDYLRGLAESSFRCVGVQRVKRENWKSWRENFLFSLQRIVLQSAEA